MDSATLQPKCRQPGRPQLPAGSRTIRKGCREVPRLPHKAEYDLCERKGKKVTGDPGWVASVFHVIDANLLFWYRKELRRILHRRPASGAYGGSLAARKGVNGSL
jgi:hypothetical protein